ncbi:hypothetical protein V8C40DRAFT_261703 [Trichoderma camerunense]
MTFAALKSGEQDGWPANNGLSHKGAELLSTIQVGMQAFVQLAQGVPPVVLLAVETLGPHNSDQAQAYEEVTQRPHEAKWSHELIGGAAAYEAAKAYEDHVAQNGHPDEHAQAKEILAGAIGFFVDREVETKGLDFIDRERAKRHAQEQAEQQLNNQYGDRW